MRFRIVLREYVPCFRFDVGPIRVGGKLVLKEGGHVGDRVGFVVDDKDLYPKGLSFLLRST